MQSVDPEIRASIVAGEKIQAIKLIRTKMNLGLKEAKDYADSIERAEGIQPKKASPITVLTIIVVLVAFFLSLGLLLRSVLP